MRRKIIKMFGIFIMLLGIYNVKSFAAISATSKTVNSGSTVSILITSNIPVISYMVEMTDSGGLEFLNSSGGTGAGGTTITDAKANGMTNLATFTFSVPNVTVDTKYRVKFSATVMDDENENPVPDDTAEAIITVKGTGNTGGTSGNTGNTGSSGSTGTTTTPTKSNNANLKNLGIRPNDFSGFSKNPSKENWSVTVPYDVEEIEVYAEKGHSAQTISGTGKKRLKEGTNNVSIVVTAEDGTKKTYKINVVRNSEDEEMVPNVIDENIEEKPEALRLTALSIQDDLNLALSPIFNSEVFEYTLEVASDLESLELSGIPNVNGAKVTIEGNDKLEEENIITLTVKADGYEDVVYTIKVIKKANEEVALISEEIVQEEPTPAELDNSIANKKIIIVVSVLAFIIISIIVILVLKRKKNNKKLYSSYYDYYNDYPNETEKLEVLKKEEENNNAEEDIFGKSEITEGYTAEIENDTEYEETPKRKRGKGKHF